jgi:hypothetical protein
MPIEKRSQFNVANLIFALVAIMLVQQWWTQAQQIEVVPYSEFETLERGAKLLLEKETLAEPELAALKSAIQPA